MIPARFDYHRAADAAHALALLGELGDEAKLLAGGHSLVPLMKLGLAQPAALVDVGDVRELSYVDERDGVLAVGALTRYRDIERSELARRLVPILAHATGRIGDPQVRARGTIGGSLAHGDPAADLPAVAVATGAVMVVRGPGGERHVPAREFFRGFLETALQPDEMLVEVRFPASGVEPWAYEKFSRRAQDYAIVGVAVVRGPEPGIALVNMDSTPVFCAAASAALGRGEEARAVAELAAADGRPPSDLNGDGAYRRHLARVLTERAVRAAAI